MRTTINFYQKIERQMCELKIISLPNFKVLNPSSDTLMLLRSHKHIHYKVTPQCKSHLVLPSYERTIPAVNITLLSFRLKGEEQNSYQQTNHCKNDFYEATSFALTAHNHIKSDFSLS